MHACDTSALITYRSRKHRQQHEISSRGSGDEIQNFSTLFRSRNLKAKMDIDRYLRPLMLQEVIVFQKLPIIDASRDPTSSFTSGINLSAKVGH